MSRGFGLSPSISVGETSTFRVLSRSFPLTRIAEFHYEYLNNLAMGFLVSHEITHLIHGHIAYGEVGIGQRGISESGSGRKSPNLH